jgi:hypothetical protein
MRKRSSRSPSTTAAATSSGSHGILERDVEHRRAHTLRTQAGDLDAGVTVGDGEPLGQRDGRVLGDGVRHGRDLGEEAGRRRRAEQIALAALHPAGQERPCRPHVRHDVDLPGGLELVVGCLGTPSGAGHAGVGEEEVDGAVSLLGGGDERDDARLAPHVGDDGQPVDLIGDRSHARLVAVGQHHAGALGGEAGRARPADAAAGSGDDDVLAGQFHGGNPMGSGGR